MKVEVEIEYSAVPPAEEVEKVRRVGAMLALNSNTAAVRRGETERGMPSIVLEFEMKTQAQNKVVDGIYREIHWNIGGEFYSDMTIRFSSKPRRSSAREEA